MTKKQTDHSVLPLIDSNSNIAFDNHDKCNVLQCVFFESDQSNVNFDNIFRQEVEDEVNNLTNNQDLQNRENLGFNIDFQEFELDGAIYRLKLGKSPGPDSLYPEMLYHAGEYFRKSILHILNL